MRMNQLLKLYSIMTDKDLIELYIRFKHEHRQNSPYYLTGAQDLIERIMSRLDLEKALTIASKEIPTET